MKLDFSSAKRVWTAIGALASFKVLVIVAGLLFVFNSNGQLTNGFIYPVTNTYTAQNIDNGKVLASDNVGPNASITVQLPNPNAIATAWTMGYSSGGGHGIVVNAPGGVYINVGQKQMTSFTIPSGTNFEFFYLQSDGTNFRVLNSTLATAKFNGIQSQNQGAWNFVFSNGYTATLADGGTVISNVFASGATTITLPSSPLVFNGWTVSFYASGNPITVNLNNVQGGTLVGPTGSSIPSYTFQPGAQPLGVISFDGGSFHVIQGPPPGSLADLRSFGAASGVPSNNQITAWLAYGCNNNVGLFLPDGVWQSTIAQSVPTSNGCTPSITGNSWNSILQYVGTSNINQFLSMQNLTIQSVGNFINFTILGNSHVQDGFLTTGLGRSHFKLRIRDVARYGMNSQFSVTNTYDLSCSDNDGAFVVIPQQCFHTDGTFNSLGTYNSDIKIAAEGVSGIGVDMDYANDNIIHGTSEGNTGGGIYLRQHTQRNTTTLDVESNGGEDIHDDGTQNILLNTTSCCKLGGGHSLVHIGTPASRPTIINGHYESITIDNAAESVMLIGPEINSNGGAFSDNGFNTTNISVKDFSLPPQTAVTNLPAVTSIRGTGANSPFGLNSGLARIYNSNINGGPYTCIDLADIKTGSFAVPISKICSFTGVAGSNLQFGTSNNYATGISTIGLTIDQNGNSIAGSNLGTSPIVFSGISGLCPGNEGFLRAIIDSTTATTGALIAGSGTHHVMGYCADDGWRVLAGH